MSNTFMEISQHNTESIGIQKDASIDFFIQFMKHYEDLFIKNSTFQSVDFSDTRFYWYPYTFEVFAHSKTIDRKEYNNLFEEALAKTPYITNPETNPEINPDNYQLIDRYKIKKVFQGLNINSVELIVKEYYNKCFNVFQKEHRKKFFYNTIFKCCDSHLEMFVTMRHEKDIEEISNIFGEVRVAVNNLLNK